MDFEKRYEGDFNWGFMKWILKKQSLEEEDEEVVTRQNKKKTSLYRELKSAKEQGTESLNWTNEKKLVVSCFQKKDIFY